MNLWVYNLREMQRRPGRMLLTLLGIALGLATVVATRLTIRTVDRAYRDLFEGVAGRPALEITARGQGSFGAGAAAGLEQVRGIKAVVPRIQSAAALVSESGSVAIPVLALDRGGAADWPVREGRPISGDGDALLDPGLADSLHLRPGESLEIWAPAGSFHLHLSGILQPRGASAAAGGQMIVSLACAQRLFSLPQRINSIQVLLDDDADPAAVQTAIAGRLPARLIVQPPGMRGELARTTLLAAEQGLSALSLVALLAATFVILNTFLLNLGERRKQVAVLRSLGASRKQVLRLLLREALLLGLAGALAGCVGGVALAIGLNFLMQKFLGIALPPPIPPERGGMGGVRGTVRPCRSFGSGRVGGRGVLAGLVRQPPSAAFGTAAATDARRGCPATLALAARRVSARFGHRPGNRSGNLLVPTLRVGTHES